MAKAVQSKNGGTSGASSAVIHALAPVKSEVAPRRQKVTTALRRAIELGELKAGDRLVESDLCARLNVSRSSLRESFRDLEVSGVLSNVSPRGLIVTPLSRADIIGLFKVRYALETMLAEEFIDHADEEEVETLSAAADLLKGGSSSPVDTLDAYRAYYDALCRGAHNKLAADILHNIQLRLTVVRKQTLAPDLLKHNARLRGAIVDCLARRDLAGVRIAVRDQVQWSADTVLAVSGFAPMDEKDKLKIA